MNLREISLTFKRLEARAAQLNLLLKAKGVSKQEGINLEGYLEAWIKEFEGLYDNEELQIPDHPKRLKGANEILLESLLDAHLAFTQALSELKHANNG